METSTKNLPRTLSVFLLAMINVAAIMSVRNWPVTAEYGFASLFFFIIAVLVFFIPVSLVAAELATGWPKRGGVYVWVKEAFGHRTGFLAIWLQWVNNLFYYPTVLSFIAATIAYIFNPELASNKIYTMAIIVVFFWGTTFLNFFGMRASGLISAIGVLFGTIIPGIFIIALGLLWYFTDRPLQIPLTLDALIPNFSSFGQIVFFTGVLLSLAGMEMSAIHARDVKDPKKNYPRAILISVLIIVTFSILGVLAIAIVIPHGEINLLAGSLQAFSYFVNAYNLGWIVPYMAALIAIGALGGLSTWTVGPIKGLLAASQSGDLPPFFRKINRFGMPVPLLIFQAIIVTAVSFLFLYMPTVSSAFWILTAIVTQLYLGMYILMFAAAIKLRYKKPQVERAYKIPGGNIGMWIIAGIGFLSSIFTLFIGFIPPEQLKTGSVLFYVGFLAIGLILACISPSIILYFKKPKWTHPLAHEIEDKNFK